MELEGEYLIEASKDEVWTALNDLQALRNAIPGCQQLEGEADNDFRAKLRLNVGPVNAKFDTSIRLENINPRESYTLVVHSTGGAVGSGDAKVDVCLIHEERGTLLRYALDYKVRGKLAQIGSRLLTNTIHRLSREFFTEFAKRIGAETETARQPGANNAFC